VRIYKAAGDINAEIRAYREVMQLEPANQQAIDAIERLAGKDE